MFTAQHAHDPARLRCPDAVRYSRLDTRGLAHHVHVSVGCCGWAVDCWRIRSCEPSIYDGAAKPPVLSDLLTGHSPLLHQFVEG